MRAARVPWYVLTALALALAAVALARWWTALSADVPALYGEGAVVHAGQLVARGLDPYGPPSPGTFVAANYPPLAYAVVAVLSPLGVFTPYRVVSVLAALAIAALVAWRARRAPLVAAALALAFLGLFPLAIWGPAVKPDLLAVALTAFAVVRAGPSWRDASLAGALGALAIAAKPTAAVPLAFVVAYLVWRERRSGIRVLVALAVALAAAAAVSLTRFSASGLYLHLVDWNALPYSVAQTGLLVLAGALTVATFAVIAARRASGRMRAYVAGAAVVVLLGGREGATVNYLLDLAAASFVALAPVLAAGRPAGRDAFVPVLLALQLLISLLAVAGGVFAPDDLALARERAGRVVHLRADAPSLAEDSGLLLAARIEPVVDDLFLWSRLVSRGAIADAVTPRVREGEIGSIIADVPLDRLGEARAYERARWPDALVAAVLARYRLEASAPSFYLYVPR